MSSKPPIGLDSISALAFHIIVSKLTPCEAAAVACLNKRFKDWASDDSLWSLFCSQQLGLSSPVDPLGYPCASFKVNSFFISSPVFVIIIAIRVSKNCFEP
ncbi:putative F-box-like domain superfamily protein [Helianthus annuus]|nr:putative F-box-like domain superfamily protein [Helianthus annuus]